MSKAPKPGNLDDVLKDAGKNEDEARRTGEIDKLDRDTDALYERRKQTVNSPVFTALWSGLNIDHFRSRPADANPLVDEAVAKSLEAVRRHRDASPSTIYGPDGKLSDALIAELAAAGYGGIRIPPELGGKGANLRQVMNMVRKIGACGDLTVAGTTNVHGLIGVVDPLLVAGTEEQKARFLPQLASWEKQSAFALTEKGAGSDLTNIQTRAEWKDGKLVVNGTKIFISNSWYGRLVALVCLIREPNEAGEMVDNKALFVVQLPDSDTENFHILDYKLHPLRHMHNHGLVFKDFPLDPANRIQRVGPDGKKVGNSIGLAYEALNKGRTAVAAMAAAGCRVILGSVAPNAWGAYRVTYGQAIEQREGVQGAIANIAMRICGLDAIVDWCATLLDDGWRGELECIVAKNFGANSITTAAIYDGMRLHGGRSMIQGHFIGDNMMEFLVNRIYEGAHDMLGMSLVLNSIRHHIDSYMGPLGEGMKAITKQGKPVAGVAKLGFHGVRLGAWWLGQQTRQLADAVGIHPQLGDSQFQKYIDFADSRFADMALKYNATMVRHQLKLIDKQLLLQRLAVDEENLVLLARCAVAGSETEDGPTRLGLDLMCRTLINELTGAKPDEAYDRDRVKLAKHVINGEFKQLDGVMPCEILMPYNR